MANIFVKIGCYELWQFQGANGGTSVKDLSEALLKFSSSTSSVLCAAFTSLFGPDDAVVCIWRHGSFDDANGLRKGWKEFTKSNNFSSFESSSI